MLSEMRYAAVELGVFTINKNDHVYTAGRVDGGCWSVTWIEVGEGA